MEHRNIIFFGYGVAVLFVNFSLKQLLIIFTVSIHICMFSYILRNICKYRIKEKKLNRMQNGGMTGGLSGVLLKLCYTFKKLILHLKIGIYFECYYLTRCFIK